MKIYFIIAGIAAAIFFVWCLFFYYKGIGRGGSRAPHVYFYQDLLVVVCTKAFYGEDDTTGTDTYTAVGFISKDTGKIIYKKRLPKPLKQCWMFGNILLVHTEKGFYGIDVSTRTIIIDSYVFETKNHALKESEIKEMGFNPNSHLFQFMLYSGINVELKLSDLVAYPNDHLLKMRIADRDKGNFTLKKQSKNERYEVEYDRESISENSFINPVIIMQQHDRCIVGHQVSLKDEMPCIVSMVTSDGKIQWDFPYKFRIARYYSMYAVQPDGSAWFYFGGNALYHLDMNTGKEILKVIF